MTTTSSSWVGRFAAASCFIGTLSIFGAYGCSPEPQARSTEQATLAASSAANRAPQSGKPLRWRLPKKLREISGLALTADQRLWAIADERALVMQLDYHEGKVIKTFAMGNPVVRADFEGIAALNKWLYLITSRGKLYVTKEAPDGGYAEYAKFDLGLADSCEVEGLGEEHRRELLWIVCKRVRGDGRDKYLHLHAWSTHNHELVTELALRLPIAAIAELTGSAEFNPSALAFTPDEDQLVLLAARQRSYAVYHWQPAFESMQDFQPQLLSAGRLVNAAQHPQAEGLAITATGQLLIADEGKNKRGTLSSYGAPWWHNNLQARR